MRRFDPFWARVGEAGIVVAPHAGFEDGYVKVQEVIAEEWGRPAGPTTGMGDAASSSVITMLMKRRLVQDFAAVLVADKPVGRNPGVRVAYH